jgi:hypothetical protein
VITERRAGAEDADEPVPELGVIAQGLTQLAIWRHPGQSRERQIRVCRARQRAEQRLVRLARRAAGQASCLVAAGCANRQPELREQRLGAGSVAEANGRKVPG